MGNITTRAQRSVSARVIKRAVPRGRVFGCVDLDYRQAPMRSGRDLARSFEDVAEITGAGDGSEKSRCVQFGAYIASNKRARAPVTTSARIFPRRRRRFVRTYFVRRVATTVCGCAPSRIRVRAHVHACISLRVSVFVCMRERLSGACRL